MRLSRVNVCGRARAHRGAYICEGGARPPQAQTMGMLVVKNDKAQPLWEDLTQAMGIDPFGVLDCFSDLGLSDAEIARYFHISPADVSWLRSRARAVAVVDDLPVPRRP